MILLMMITTGCVNDQEKNFIRENYVLELEEGNIYGTLTIPKTHGPFPIALIIQGAGATNRDGNNKTESLINNHLRMLSESLGNAGIASLRYDKRGIGQSSKIVEKPEDLIFEDYIDDVLLWMDKIKSDSRFSSHYIIGHGEGGLVGSAAAGQVELNGFISIGAPGIALHETLIKQLETRRGEVSERDLEIINDLRNGNMVDISPKELGPLFHPRGQAYLISLFKHEPQLLISQVEDPILIIQGDNDLQARIKDARLLQEAAKGELVIIKGMNHILKECSWDDKENIATYSKPRLPLHKELVKELVTFIFNSQKKVG